MDDASTDPTGSWLYVSEIAIPPPRREEEIAAIVRVARDRNARHGITGCLLASGRHFAQWVEGPPGSLAALRRNILADPRHEVVVTVDEGSQAQRQFASWTLGYFGPSHFVSRVMAGPLRTWSHDRSRGAAQLLDLMRRLSQDEDLAGPAG